MPFHVLSCPFISISCPFMSFHVMSCHVLICCALPNVWSNTTVRKILLHVQTITITSTTINEKWNFVTPDSRRYAEKNGSIRYNLSLRKKVSIPSTCISFSFWRSYCVDNTAYFFLSHQGKILKILQNLSNHNFTRFGLTVYLGDG